MGGEGLAEALVVFSVLAFFAFLIWNRTRSNLDRRRLELDAQTRMLEKIGPGQALTDFLKTEEGKQFFHRLTAGSASIGGKDTRTQIFVLTTLGLVALGAGFFFIMAVSLPSTLTPGTAPVGARVLAYVPVFLLSGAGVGALIAAWLMTRLSKKWGMLEPEKPYATTK
jgi:hypothetical protein